MVTSEDQPRPLPFKVFGVRRLLPWIVGLLGVLALILAVSQFGSLERIVELTRSAHPAWLFLAGLVQAASYVCAALVWRQALRYAGHPRTLWTLVPLGIAKLFTDQVLPSGGVSGTMLVVTGLIRRRVPAEIAMAAMLAGYYDFKQEEFVLQFVNLKDGTQSLAWFNLPAVLITVAITIILVIGIRESAGFNAAMVLVNIGVVLTVIGVGVAYVDPANWRPFLHEDKQYRGIALGAARIFIAYIGFDSISTHAEEARQPQRDLALGIMGALVVCTVLYVAVAAVLTGMIPYRQINEAAPLSAALQAKGLTFAGGLITLGILAGMTSSLLVGNLSQPRILLAMARDGLLPHSFFGAVHSRFKTPWKATILVGVVVALGGALAPLGFLADLVSIGTLFAFVIVSAAVWILRISDPDVPRPFRTPLAPCVSIMGVLVNGGLMFSLGRDNWIRLVIWLIVGLFIYIGYSRHHSVLSRRTALAAGGSDPGLAVAGPASQD